MRKLMTTLLLVLLFTGCSTKGVTKRKVSSPKVQAIKTIDVTKEYTDLSRDFLAVCESDVSSSAEVISKKKLIGALSHLNLMNRGGRKYYLLEKQNITAMLNKLSSYPYTECYLVDHKGKIVYAMYNDKLVGRKIRNFEGSPIYGMFKEGVSGESSIRDVTTFPALSGSHDLYFSRPIYSDDRLEGVFITAVHIKNLGNKLPPGSKIVGRDGMYRFHNELSQIYEADTVFTNSVKHESEKHVRYSDGYYVYQPFNYKSINWVLVIKEQRQAVLNQR